MDFNPWHQLLITINCDKPSKEAPETINISRLFSEAAPYLKIRINNYFALKQI